MSDIADEVLEMMREISVRVNSEVQPNEFTVNMFAEKMGIDQKRAARLLNSEVDAGRLTSRTAYDPVTGRAVKAYRTAE